MPSETQSSSFRVVVLGGGILGVSAAVHLVAQGVAVTLVTEEELASGASGRSLSWLNSAGEKSEAYHVLRMAGIERYRRLKADRPEIDWLEFEGAVYWSTDPARTQNRHECEKQKFYPSELMDSESLADTYPGINAEAINGTAVKNPGEGWVSLPHLIEDMADRLRRDGASIADHVGKCEVLVEVPAGQNLYGTGKAVGVRTSYGDEIRGDMVVVACGAQTPAVVADLGVHIGDASPLSMLVISEPFDVPEPVVLNTPRAAVRPNPGGTVAIDHSWYEDRIVENEDQSHSISTETVDELLDEAAKLYAGTPGIRAASWKLGRKPIPADGQPVFGELQAIPGCYIAFTHSGATLGLIAGELIAKEVVERVRDPRLETFRPERFT